MPNPWATFWTAMTVQRLYFWCAWKGESSGIVRFLPRDWCILSLWDCSANREIFMISWAVLWSLWDCSAGLACYCIHNGRRLPVTMHLFLAFSCIGIVTSNIVALLISRFCSATFGCCAKSSIFKPESLLLHVWASGFEQSFPAPVSHCAMSETVGLHWH